MAFASWRSDRDRFFDSYIVGHYRPLTDRYIKTVVVKCRPLEGAQCEKDAGVSSRTLRRHTAQGSLAELQSPWGRRIFSVTEKEVVEHRQRLARPVTADGVVIAHGRVSSRRQAKEGDRELQMVPTAQQNSSAGRAGGPTRRAPLPPRSVSRTHRDRNCPTSRFWSAMANDREFGNNCVN